MSDVPAGTPKEQLLQEAARLTSVAEHGLHFSDNDFDRERYAEIAHIAERLAQMALGPLEGIGLPDIPALMAARAAGHTKPGSPNLAVRGFAYQDGKVVLVREKLDDCWCLPGGIAEVGLSPRASMEKEWREETQAPGIVGDLIGVYDKPPSVAGKRRQHWYELVFKVELTGPLPDISAFANNSEILEVAAFPLDALPPLSFYRTTEDLLHGLVTLSEAEQTIATFELD